MLHTAYIFITSATVGGLGIEHDGLIAYVLALAYRYSRESRLVLLSLSAAVLPRVRTLCLR